MAALDKFTVQSYLDNYTSEDNASFEELAKMHNRRERVKNAWMYDAEKKHNESLVYRQQEMIEDADKQLVAKRNQEGIITSSYKLLLKLLILLFPNF